MAKTSPEVYDLDSSAGYLFGQIQSIQKIAENIESEVIKLREDLKKLVKKGELNKQEAKTTSDGLEFFSTKATKILEITGRSRR